MWQCTWTNYMLYMASINNDAKEEKEVIETKDSDDIF